MKTESIFKTNKDIEQLNDWIIALESEVHPQARGQLEGSTGFCCLGLACALFIPEQDLTLAKSNSSVLSRISGGLPVEQLHAPNWLKEINTDFQLITGDRLVTLNDQHHLSFLGIAEKLRQAYAEFIHC